MWVGASVFLALMWGMGIGSMMEAYEYRVVTVKKK